jgi:hypothetical protein
MKMDLKESGYGGVEWIYLAQGRVQWKALASTVLNFGVAKKTSNLVSSKRLVPHVVPRPTELVADMSRCLSVDCLVNFLLFPFSKCCCS